MIPLFFFMYVIFSYVPPLHSAINNSVPNCPASFSCPGLSTFKYPFYNITDKRCGLIKVNCTSQGGEIQIGRNLYTILSNQGSPAPNSIRLFLLNHKFDELVKSKRCEALENNFTSPSPSPLLYSISITDFITLFKCTKNIPYFERKYNSYKRCNKTFYYNYLNKTVPSNLSHSCKVVQLPVYTPSIPGFDETKIFSLLYPGTSIFFNLSQSCNKCLEQNRYCEISKGVVQCFDVKKVSPSSNQENPGRERKIRILVIVGGSIAILIVSLFIFVIWRQCKNNPFSYVSTKNRSQNLDDISLTCGVSVFSYKELEDATQNFNPSRELGDGGFGAVYYGKLKDGREVAVKKLHEHNYNRVQHFRNEVEILTKLRHPNLVVLYGCTSRHSNELLLVYEYVPNGTVSDHLHGEHADLTWPIRMNIAIETASALVYLHASEIIHRDVKTNNILLDHNFSVKVADFGLSRLLSNNAIHVSTAPQGTPGYVDPQYHQRYQLTDKSDVYSFGVVLIELISSMVAVDLNRPQDEISLDNLAINRIQTHATDELIDPVLGSDSNPEIMNMITLVAELAFRCLQYDSDMRPTMNEVLDVLMDIQYSERNLQTVNVQPLSETNDAVILLKDASCSPVSITSKWISNNSASTTLSINGDKT